MIARSFLPALVLALGLTLPAAAQDAALGTLFTKAAAQTQVAGILLKSLVSWRLFMLLFRLYLRPDLAVARIGWKSSVNRGG